MIRSASEYYDCLGNSGKEQETITKHLVSSQEETTTAKQILINYIEHTICVSQCLLNSRPFLLGNKQ